VLAAKDGFAQILWLFGEKHNITEVGTMNAFTVWKNKSGARELITPPLDGTILPGVTRDSILQLAKNWKDISVLERPYTIHDVLEALEEKRVRAASLPLSEARTGVVHECVYQHSPNTQQRYSCSSSLVLVPLPSWRLSRASSTTTKYVSRSIGTAG